MRELQEFDKTPLSQVREFVIDQLKINYAHDNIIEQEFESRLERATESPSKQGLLELVADLPRIEENAPAVSAQSRDVSINTGAVKEVDNMVAVLAGTTRRGVWKPARATRIVSVLGGTDLDFTEAEMPPGVTELDIFCMLGGVDIKVPPGVKVETDVVAILGGADNHADTPDNPSCPTIRIRGFALLGGVDVKTKRKKRRKR